MALWVAMLHVRSGACCADVYCLSAKAGRSCYRLIVQVAASQAVHAMLACMTACKISCCGCTPVLMHGYQLGCSAAPDLFQSPWPLSWRNPGCSRQPCWTSGTCSNPCQMCMLAFYSAADVPHTAQAAAPLGRELERLVSVLAAAAAEQRAWRSERQALQARACGSQHECWPCAWGRQGVSAVIRAASATSWQRALLPVQMSALQQQIQIDACGCSCRLHWRPRQLLPGPTADLPSQASPAACGPGSTPRES